MDNSQFPSQGQSVDELYGVGHDSLVQRIVQRTFLWMTLGLAITGLASVYTVDSGLVFRLIGSNSFYFLLIADIGTRDEAEPTCSDWSLRSVLSTQWGHTKPHLPRLYE